MKILTTNGTQQDLPVTGALSAVLITGVIFDQKDIKNLMSLNPVALHSWLLSLYTRFPPPTEKDEHNE